MKTKIPLIGTLALLASLTSAWGADIFGRWIAKTEGRQGTVETIFNFKAEGTTLTGTVSGRQGETAISEGKIEGDDISFVVVRSNGGNQRRLLYKGKISGDEIKMTRETEGGNGQPREFIAKREFQRDGDVPVTKTPLKKP